MIFIVDWQVFQQRTANGNVYVVENEDNWDFYHVVQGSEIMKCTVAKNKEKPEENIMFVERNINDKTNIVRCFKVDQDFTATVEVKPIVEISREEEMPEELPDVQDVDEDIANA